LGLAISESKIDACGYNERAGNSNCWPDELIPHFLPFKLRRNKKGHRYIVHIQGPPEPTCNTQAMPLSPGAPTSMRLQVLKTGGFGCNAKSSVLKHYSLIHLTIPVLWQTSKENQGIFIQISIYSTEKNAIRNCLSKRSNSQNNQ